jgi:CRP/FNR family cyclic AMP-dependent transcriptional regulator
MTLSAYSTDDVLEHFRNARVTKTLPAGTVIFRAGDPPDFLYILMEGQANIMVGNAIVEIAARGALLGEMALIDGKPRTATVVTRTICKVVPIDTAHFDLLVHETPAFSRYVMNAMAERMRRMNNNLRATQPIGGVNARVTANTALSMEEDATLPPVRSR